MLSDIAELRVALPYAVGVGVLAAAIARLSGRGYRRSIGFGISALYVSLVIYRCFLNREVSEGVVFDPYLFSTVANPSSYHYYIDNVILFIPMGVILLLAFRSTVKSIITGVAISLFIEVSQLMTGLGSFHLDDLMANGIGCVMGAVTGMIVVSLRKTE